MPATQTRREHGMLFADRLVRAFLDELKGQTRRPIKPTPPERTVSVSLGMDINGVDFGAWFVSRGPQVGVASEHNYSQFIKCPWNVGDLIWVREAWYDYGQGRHRCEHWTEADGARDWYWHSVLNDKYHEMIRYRADNPTDLIESGNGHNYYHRLRPSIHMPRWAARLWYEITDIRVERVQSISATDCHAEGIPFVHAYTPQAAFSGGWDQHYGATEYAWAKNPHVWALSLKRTEAPDARSH